MQRPNLCWFTVCTTELNLHTPDLVVFCTVPIDNVAVAANNSITATTMFANNVAGTGGNTGYVLVEPTVTPQFIHNLYGMPADIKGTNSGNSQSVAEFLKQVCLFACLLCGCALFFLLLAKRLLRCVSCSTTRQVTLPRT